jgi:alkylmercury lyase-like protein
MTLEIRTAAEMIALDVEGRGAARRAARETEVLQRVLWAFVDRPGPVRVAEVAATFLVRTPESVHQALARLDEEDLVRIEAGRVDLAYPFSASPTPFVVDLDRGPRYVCCAIDALGIAPMLGRRVRIRSRCHHCAEPVGLSVGPSGPDPDSIMVWVGKRAEDDRRACDAL